MIPFLICLSAILLDRYVGQPRSWHPLAMFRDWAEFVESLCYGGDVLLPHQRRRRGILALALAVLPLVLIAGVLSLLGPLGLLFDVLVLYLALAGSRLTVLASAVAEALRRFDLNQARRKLGRLINGDTLDMDEQAVTKVAVESVLVKGNDAVFAVLFWYLVLGAPGVVMFRLVNTLDALWGYRNNRYINFGWAAARFDDVLNWLPSRLTALTYTLLGDRARAWRCWQQQATQWHSLNDGPIVAAGAGALAISVGGEIHQHGEVLIRAQLGEGPTPQPADIERGLVFVRQGQWWWLVIIFLLGLI